MKKRVLVIDEDLNTLHLISVRLNKVGFATFLARDGNEGLNLALAEKPHLVIMEIQLTNEDGLALINGTQLMNSLGLNAASRALNLVGRAPADWVAPHTDLLIGYLKHEDGERKEIRKTLTWRSTRRESPRTSRVKSAGRLPAASIRSDTSPKAAMSVSYSASLLVMSSPKSKRRTRWRPSRAITA